MKSEKGYDRGQFQREKKEYKMGKKKQNTRKNKENELIAFQYLDQAEF